MNAVDFIKFKQRAWADRFGINLIGSKNERGEKNYTSSLNDNLFEPLSADAEKEFRDADGNELLCEGVFPCKMQALHSSSALAVNIFHYWKNKNISNIASACGLCRNESNEVRIVRDILFEQKYPISEKFDKCPNIDVIINNPDDNKYKVYAIECKFTEPYVSERENNQKGLKEKYLGINNIWDDIPELHKLAISISPEDKIYNFLHPAQLIKHILGLKKKYGKTGFRLLYLWYDAFDEEGYRHRSEIESFKEAARKDDVAFNYISYQELIYNLQKRIESPDIEYLRYIEQRYI